jgi:hypothetical protein
VDTFFLLIEADRTSFGAAFGRLYRTIKVERDPRQRQRANPFQYHLG